ncbi:MAG: hypothetical protein ISS70_01465 [Phycisphaerae bacterium]|nr:hypothetical protein [Phycisphaerae bacterium]
MPAWNQKLQKYVRDGKLVVLGIAQEQHPQRNRLFTQWHRIDWPVLHDPINLMQVTGVPVEVAIDEEGIVRSTRVKAETLERDFINKTFSLYYVCEDAGGTCMFLRQDIPVTVTVDK